MGFLRRLFGGSTSAREAAEPDDVGPAPEDSALDAEVLRIEDARLDEFRLRQIRFARYAWRPPAQGGKRRADDGLDSSGDTKR